MKKIFYIIILILIITGIIYFWPRFVVQEPQQQEPAAQDEFADWQTYRNEEYGFSLRYPKGWNVKDITSLDKNETDLLVLTFHSLFSLQETYSFHIGVADNSLELSVTDYIRKYCPWLTEKDYIKEIDVGGNKGPQFLSSNGALTDVIMIPKNNKIYGFYRNFGHGIENPVEIFNQILSTFKFIE